MKRFLVFMLIVSAMMSCGVPALADESSEPEEEAVQLSSLDEESCIEILGVTVPDSIKGQISVVELVKYIEEHPEVKWMYNHPDAGKLFQDVRAAVISYYGLAYTTTFVNSEQYELQDSILVSEKWDASMLNYNCYGYAIDKLQNCSPGFFSGGNYDGTQPIREIAKLVEKDLNALGYNCVLIQETRPTLQGKWTRVIAVRRQIDASFNDFHFAFLDVSNWKHKPGQSAILQFKEAPDNSKVWTDEQYTWDEYVKAGIEYASDIEYILYKKSHRNLTHTYTGENYHHGSYHYYKYLEKCDDCGTKTVWESVSCYGPPCPEQFYTLPKPGISDVEKVFLSEF